MMDAPPATITACNLPGWDSYGSGKAVDFALVVLPCTTPLPPLTHSASHCENGTVTLTASGCSGTYSWYSSSSSDVVLGTNSSFTTPALSTTTNYFVSCTVNNCESTRTVATATIIAPTITSNASEIICAGAPMTLTASGCTGTITWSTGATGSSLTVKPTASASYIAFCKLPSGCVRHASY